MDKLSQQEKFAPSYCEPYLLHSCMSAPAYLWVLRICLWALWSTDRSIPHLCSPSIVLWSAKVDWSSTQQSILQSFWQLLPFPNILLLILVQIHTCSCVLSNGWDFPLDNYGTSQCSCRLFSFKFYIFSVLSSEKAPQHFSWTSKKQISFTKFWSAAPSKIS